MSKAISSCDKKICHICPDAGNERRCPEWQNFKPPEEMIRKPDDPMKAVPVVDSCFD